jgi:aspartyl protease
MREFATRVRARTGQGRSGHVKHRNLTRLGALSLVVVSLSACATIGGPAEPARDGALDSPDAEVHDYQMGALTARLETMPRGVERDYFSGILASRSGRSEDAMRLLTRVLPDLRTAHRQRAATALQALAETYLLSCRYREAALAFDEIEQHFADMHLDVADDAALARILREAPAQTVEWQGPVRVPTSRNPIGSVDSEITIGGIRERWLLDTAANQSVVSRSYAERLGLTPVAGVASVGSGITGRTSSLRAAIVPEVRLGGATVSNVVVLILDDANLRIGTGTDVYQINAILGYPTLRALGRITFTRDGQFLAGGTGDQSASVPMFLRGLTPAIECEVDDRRLLFTFDTGASSSDFSVRYYESFRRRHPGWRRRTVESGGAGGTVKRHMYVQPTVTMKVGERTVALHDVEIFPVRMNASIDVLFGNLGQDFVAEFESFTLDSVNMTFSVSP